MMQQAGGQGAESRHPSSPRGGSSAGGSNNSLSKFSLLGQQLTSFGSGQQQQQQQGHNHTSTPNQAGGMSFSLGMHAHGQSFSQGHQQPQSQQQPHQSQPTGNNSNGDGSGFTGMPQNVNSLGLSGQGYNSNQQFMNQQMLQQASGGVAEFLKMSQQEGVQPASQGSLPSGAGVESLMSALSSIQQKISQLQAIVPFMGQNQQMPNSVQQQQVQQQAAAAISQIAQVAANMFPSKQQQQQNMASGQQQQQQQQLTNGHQQFNQLFGASVGAPGFNFFQHGGCPPGGSGNGLGNNSYAPMQGGGGGIGMDLAGPPVAAASTGNLANQLVDGGVSGNPSNAAVPGLGGGGGAASKSAPTSGSGQGFGTGGGIGGGAGAGAGGTGGGGNGSAAGGSQGGGGNNGSTMAASVNSTMVGRPRQGSPLDLPSQMGSGMNSRGGSVAPSGDGIPHSSGRSSMNSGMAVTGSPMDERDDCVGGVLDEDEEGDAEHLLPGQYDLVEMDASEILAEHTHFCEICGKGFKRDANLRMHMRGHGDEYKTPAALARPDKASHEVSVVRQRRFSCPYVGCKRNKKHRKFQPLKTMLCVKNHYRRSHCPKILTCNKCKTKKFSVVADLKTHEKHCGCDKWQCSCGTTFSRKDKLIGHIALFTGHTPAMPFTDVDGSGHIDVSDMGGGAGNPPSLSNPGNNAIGYGMSAGGNLNPGSASGMGVGGGSGMGLSENGLQGLSSRGGSQGGGNSLSATKDGNVLAPENSSSSDSFPTMQSLFMSSFLQSTSGGNSSPDGLH